MTIDDLRDALAARTNPAGLAAFSGSIALQMGAGTSGAFSPAGSRLLLQVKDGELRWLPSDATAEAVFYFASTRQALAVLSGEAHVMEEFMAGRFRSDGYLLWTTPLLGLFRG